MRMRTAYAAAAFGAMVLATGCATIVGGGSSQAVMLDGTPSEARYTVRSSSGIEMSAGSLPASFTLPRKNEYQVDVSLDGYETRTLAVTRGTNGWIWGNLVFGWIVGFIVDFATGAAYKLEPSLINVTLERSDETVAVLQFFNDDHELIREERLQMVPIN
jgi:hypothetical protein